MKRVALTGGTGYIGAKVLPLLVERGYEIHMLCRNMPQHACTNIPEGVHVHIVDLFDSQATEQIISSISASHLLHLAWYAEHGRFWTSPLNAQWQVASLHILHAFQAAGGQRAVFAGTCAEYDWSHGFCVEDLTPCKPSTFYGACKAGLNAVVSDWSKQFGLSTAWGRIFFIYGENEHPNRLVASVTSKLLRGERAQCSHGRQFRDFMHVRDVARAFIDLLDCDVLGTVNISTGQPVMLRDLVTAIGSQLNAIERIDFGAIAVTADDPPMIVGSASRLKMEVDFTPEFDLQCGIRDTIEWWRNRQD